MRRTTRREPDSDLLRLREGWLREALVQQLARGEIISTWNALFAPSFMPLTRPPTTEELRDRPDDFAETPDGWLGRLPRAERYAWAGGRALTLTMDAGGFVLRTPNGLIIRDREKARLMGLSFVAGRSGPEPDASPVDLIDWLPSGRRRAAKGRGRSVSVLTRALYVRAALAAGVSHYAAVQEIAGSFPDLLPPADLEAWAAVQPRVTRWDPQPVRDARLEMRGTWLQATRRLLGQHRAVWAQLGLPPNLR
jgi:hypothetical protein